MSLESPIRPTLCGASTWNEITVERREDGKTSRRKNDSSYETRGKKRVADWFSVFHEAETRSGFTARSRRLRASQTKLPRQEYRAGFIVGDSIKFIADDYCHPRDCLENCTHATVSRPQLVHFVRLFPRYSSIDHCPAMKFYSRPHRAPIRFRRDRKHYRSFECYRLHLLLPRFKKRAIMFV